MKFRKKDPKTCRVECMTHSLDKREFEITSDGRVWPCCYYANAWDARFDKDKDLDNHSTYLYKLDPIMTKLDTEDPNWNNLEFHDLDEIIDHEIYWTHLWLDGWEKETKAPLCMEECGVYIDERTGKETTNSRLD